MGIYSPYEVYPSWFDEVEIDCDRNCDNCDWDCGDDLDD